MFQFIEFIVIYREKICFWKLSSKKMDKLNKIRLQFWRFKRPLLHVCNTWLRIRISKFWGYRGMRLIALLTHGSREDRFSSPMSSTRLNYISKPVCQTKYTVQNLRAKNNSWYSDVYGFLELTNYRVGNSGKEVAYFI